MVELDTRHCTVNAVKIQTVKGNTGLKSSLIRQNGCFEKTKHVKFSKKLTFITVSGGKKCSFFGKFDVLCFLETPVFRVAFLPYYRQNMLRISPDYCLSNIFSSYCRWFSSCSEKNAGCSLHSSGYDIIQDTTKYGNLWKCW